MKLRDQAVCLFLSIAIVHLRAEEGYNVMPIPSSKREMQGYTDALTHEQQIEENEPKSPWASQVVKNKVSPVNTQDHNYDPDYDSEYNQQNPVDANVTWRRERREGAGAENALDRVPLRQDDRVR